MLSDVVSEQKDKYAVIGSAAKCLPNTNDAIDWSSLVRAPAAGTSESTDLPESPEGCSCSGTQKKLHLLDMQALKSRLNMSAIAQELADLSDLFIPCRCGSCTSIGLFVNRG